MLSKLITRSILKDLAGTTSFRRGEEYLSAGAVGRLRVTDDKITAKVEGTATYRVELIDDDGALSYDCTCPYAADGNFCKHCVAVGLAWLAETPLVGKSEGKTGQARRPDPWRDIEAYLATQPARSLIELLLDVAQRDDRLYQSLLLQAGKTVGGGNVIAALRHAIDEVTQIHGFIDWRENATFAGNVEQVADTLAELLKPATSPILVELAEYAIERIEGALEQVDDSSGYLGDIVYRLGEMHHKACAMAKPDPVALAERLFRFETTLPFGLCSFDANTYRKALGKKGLQRYRELAESAWRKVKPRGGRDGFDGDHYRITRVMEQLAEASGNVEELVAIKSRDLSSGYRYLGIAEIWAKARQPDKALEWAERGLKAFPDRPDNRLRDFLVAAYLKRKRKGAALQLTWVQFDEHPSPETFQKLHGVAGKFGIWPAQRERALARLADTIKRKAAAPGSWKHIASAPDYSLRVAIALWEKDLEAAWTAAHQGICDGNLLIALAGKLEASRPNDAISLYRRVASAIVEQTNNTAYEEAIKLVRKVGTLMRAQKQAHQFGDYLAELRVRFKPKRNFIKLLDGVRRS